MAFIALHNVSINKRLENVTLTLQSGEFLGLVGGNGAGKTTLLRVMSGLLRAETGRVAIDELPSENVYQRTPIHQRVAMVHADPETQLVAPSVFEEVAFGLRVQGIPRDEIIRRVDNTLTQFDFSHLREVHPFSLSAGEQHRLVLAARLVTEPSFVLLDEVTSMLDVLNRNTLLSFLRNLAHHQQVGVMLVTHRLEDLLQADHIAVLSAGQVVADDAPHQIMRQAHLHPDWGIEVPSLVRLALDNAERSPNLGQWLPRGF